MYSQDTENKHAILRVRTVDRGLNPSKTLFSEHIHNFISGEFKNQIQNL